MLRDEIAWLLLGWEAGLGSIVPVVCVGVFIGCGSGGVGRYLIHEMRVSTVGFVGKI